MPTPVSAGTATLRPTVAEQDAEDLPEPVWLAIERAASDYEIEIDSVQLVSYVEQAWPSPALGCPEEGRFYPQVVTHGFIVTLAVQAQTVEYHTDTGMNVVQCVESAA